jgi:hypothetical protein
LSSLAGFRRSVEEIKVSEPLEPCQIKWDCFGDKIMRDHPPRLVSKNEFRGVLHSFPSFFAVCYIHSSEESQMSLAEKIQKDLVDAMRAKDELRLSVLRGIKSAIKLKEVEKIKTLDEPETIQILQTLVKQRKESIDQFTKGNRHY